MGVFAHACDSFRVDRVRQQEAVTAMVLTDRLLTGRYQFGRLLGSGGFGEVYQAEDLRLRRTVAIKVFSASRLAPDEVAEASRLFESEALTLARLRHPGLTAVWDYFNQDDEWFLVMEYVPGETLRDVLKRVGGRLPLDQTLDYVSQLCAVLHYLHSQREPVVFRDLKPANIIVTPSGQLKLIDFGIARLFSLEKMADTSQFGTPGYAPPEQYGGQTEPRSDIYSLGAVALQMLTGHNPAGSPFALPPARAVDPALSRQVEEVLLRATAREPRDRFPSVNEFCAALRRAVVAPEAPSSALIGPTVPISTGRAEPAPTLLRSEPSSRPLWTPAPRALPEPPRQSGVARGVFLLLLVFLLLGSLGIGGWLMRDQLQMALGSVVPLRQTGAPAISIPGTLAYVAPNERGGTDLFVRSGTRVERLTDHASGSDASLPAISPDGTRIAYGVFADGRETLWMVNRDGSGRRQLLPEYPIARAPSWSPDGSRLAVEVAGEAEMVFRQHDIVELELATGTVRPVVASDGWEGGPAWSPDGKRIVFNGRPKSEPCMSVYMVELPRGTATPLSKLADAGQCTRGNGDLWPAWSPDGRRIAFGRKIGESERIAVMDVATGTTEEWDTGALPAGHPRWSPDGASLVFEEEPAGKPKTLARLHLETGQVEPIDPEGSGSLADWR